MVNLAPFASIISLAAAAAVILSQTELWQRKEYRLDRFRSWLNSSEGKLLGLSWSAGLGALLIFGWAAFLFTMGEAVSETAAWIVLLSFFIYHLRRTQKRGLFRPRLTGKAKLILGIAAALALLSFASYYTLGQLPALQWATLLWVLPLLVGAAAAAANIPADIRKQQIIDRAEAHRRKFKKLTVVGITGSYGKTSVKHFALQLIPDAKGTKEHHNSRIGVALDVLENINKDTKTYIAEAGAYRTGEVAEIAKIIRPQIAVITAIGNQHLELFGSQEEILKTKWELVRALPPGGLAILNADSPLLLRLKTKKKVLTYSTHKPADIYASAVAVKPASLECVLHLMNSRKSVTIPLAGRGTLSSVLAAAAIAYAVGVPAADIFSRIQKLKPFPRTMEIKAGRRGSIVIDDSYSANEVGVLAALEHLTAFPQPDKRIVLTSLIELGPAAAAVHEKIGRALGISQAKVFLSGRDHEKDILKGLRQAGNSVKLQIITDPKELARTLAQGVSKKSVVLLEGRLPDVVRLSVING